MHQLSPIKIENVQSWHLEIRDAVQKSPAKPLKTPKTGDTDVVPFTEDEVQKILKACAVYDGPNRDRLVILTELMLETGLRIGDAATIAKSRVVKKSAGWVVELRTAKTGTAVSCPIPSELRNSILALDGETPFWSGKSDLEDVTKNWRKIYERVFTSAGIEGHPHQFRHTTAKRLLVRGVSIDHVASLLGHGVKVCQKHYSKWVPERQDAFDKAIRAARGVATAVSPADVRQTNQPTIK